MLPVIDYGSIAVVIPHVTAVGNLIDSEGKTGFEVFITGLADPIIIGFEDPGEADDAREELIAVVAQYHIIKTMGPDFEFPEFPEDDDNINEH